MDLIAQQIALEREFSEVGFAIHTARIQDAQEGGRADTCPYAKAMFRDYVPSVAGVIAEEMNSSKPGRNAAHLALLKGLDPVAIAFLAVRFALTNIGATDATLSKIVFGLGRTVYRELVLDQIAEALPDLFHVLSEDLDRRLSRDESHRYETIRVQAEKNGHHVPRWPNASRAAVGAYLAGLLSAVGLVEVDTGASRIDLAPDVMARMRDITTAVGLMLPAVGPCVAPPLPRMGDGSGGFYTARLAARYPVFRGKGQVEFPGTVLRAINMIQGTAWQVNTEILDVAVALAKQESFGEIVSTAALGTTKPPRPEWIPEDKKMADMDEREQAALRSWKTATRLWHEKNKLNAGTYRRFCSAIRMAQRYREHRSIWYVWFADSRGRLYPAVSGGISPQGSDLQKALLRFADAMPLSTPSAVRWFLINGANKWGFDKATLDARAAWAAERDELLIAFAEDPLSNRGWMDADSPMQFLAWCMEYARWRRDPEFFVSQLPVGMDGSCNGLQNLSACLRDEVGGKATNLSVNEVMEDIYRRVAEAAMLRLADLRYEEEDKEIIRQTWVKVGVSRTLTKRSVMTTPYGVTRLTAERYLVSDNLAAGAVPEFSISQYKMAASVLMDAVWPAIGDVVVKGTQLMTWLKKSSRKIIKVGGDPRITWTSPSGFPASQTYYEEATFRVLTRLHGKYQIRIAEKRDIPDSGRHASGMAPNFVHSLDAAHLHLTVASLAEQGITSIMAVHDDLGCHAANADVLFKTIRQEFVDMYTEHDPVQELCSKYDYLTDPPSKGSLNIEEVLLSDYFFS